MYTSLGFYYRCIARIKMISCRNRIINCMYAFCNDTNTHICLEWFRDQKLEFDWRHMFRLSQNKLKHTHPTNQRQWKQFFFNLKSTYVNKGCVLKIVSRELHCIDSGYIEENLKVDVTKKVALSLLNYNENTSLTLVYDLGANRKRSLN